MAIIADYGDALSRYLMRRLPDSETAKDVAQETFLKLIQAADHRVIHAPQAYLFRIASNLIYERNVVQRRSPIRFDSGLAERTEFLSPDTSADELPECLGVHQQLQQLQAFIPRLHLEILILKQLHGLTLREIALECRISIHTAKKYLYQARAFCRQCIKKTAAGGYYIDEQLFAKSRSLKES